jgi:hypothetical protein
MDSFPPHLVRWAKLLLGVRGLPGPKRLAAQFDAAIITHICTCGCNSFDTEVRTTPDLLPIAIPGPGGGVVFEADFTLEDGRSLELLLYCDGAGNLAELAVECEGNCDPVPDDPVYDPVPTRISSSPSILAD